MARLPPTQVSPSAGATSSPSTGSDIAKASGNLVEYGYLIRNASAIDGAQNNTIQNTTITLDRSNINSRGIMQTATTTGGGVTPTNATGSNSENLYQNLTIRNVYAGVWFNGNTTFRDVNTRITTTACGIFNSIGDPNTTADIGGGNLTTSTYGIQASNQEDFTISNNEIRNVSNTTGQLDGINVTTFSGLCTISNNIIRTIQRSGSTTTVMSGIRNTHRTTGTNTMRMFNNAIMDLDQSLHGRR